MITAETRPVVQHKPWSSDHIDTEDGSISECCRAISVGSASVDLTEDMTITVWGTESRAPLTSADARQLAASLVELAGIAEAIA